MNEWEIDEAVDRQATHPVLGPAARFLRDFKNEVNKHSDGWPYWGAACPCRGEIDARGAIARGDRSGLQRGTDADQIVHDAAWLCGRHGDADDSSGAVIALPVRYRDASGMPLISVTQVLTVAGRINAEWFTPESAERGRMVHQLTEEFDRGLDLRTPPGLEGYLDAYATFKAIVRPTYEEIEARYTNARLGLGGRIDRVCSDLWGSPAIVDFKTGSPEAWHGQQLSAYNVLRPTGARYCVYLGSNGKYSIKMYDDPADHRRFMFDLARLRGHILPDGDFWIPVTA